MESVQEKPAESRTPTGDAPDTRHEHEHGHDLENERLRDALGERLVELRSMSLELKVFTAVAAVVLVTLAALSLLRNSLLDHLVTSPTFSPEADGSASISQTVFIVCVVFVCLGWALVVTAASRAGWITRIATLAALGLAFGTERTAARDLNLATSVAAGVLVGLIALIVILTRFGERDEVAAVDTSKGVSRRWRVGRWLVFPVSLLIFLALYGLIWHESNTNGFSDNFPASVADQLSNIQWLLIPIITLAGADFGDWGNFTAGRTLARARKVVPSPAFLVLALLVASGIVADGIRISNGDGSGIKPELATGALVALVAAVLVVATRPRDRWPANYPYLALVACVLIDTIVYYVISVRVKHDATGYRADGWDALIWLVLAGLGLTALLVMRGRLPDWLLGGAILATLVGAVYSMTSLDSITSIVHVFGWTPDTSPWLGYEGLKAVAGLLTIAVIVIAVLSRKLLAWAQPIVLLLRLTISLQVLAWVDSLYGGAIRKAGAVHLAGQLALAAAVVLVLALSWEFATSGESITNGTHPRFPRDTRVMLFLGYIIITGSDSVFFSNVGVMEGGKWHVLESQFEAEQYVQKGLLFLGGPLVITIFIIAFNRWRHHSASAQTERTQAPRSPVHA